MEAECPCLTCPICTAHLHKLGRVYQCANNHSFDIAREGYVNLLMGKPLGDAREMLLARRRFLEQGFYDPLSDAINTLVRNQLADAASQMPDSDADTILDVGCGEGYYLGRLKSSLRPATTSELCFVGLDASKEAVRLAARKYTAIKFVVSNAKRRLPFHDSAIAVVLNMLAPRNGSEFERVIAPGGLLFVAIPTKEHLEDLRDTFGLLGIEEDKEQRVIHQFGIPFQHIKTCHIGYDVLLSQTDVIDLIMMGPNYWHVARHWLQDMQAMTSFRTQVGFSVLVFRKYP